MITATSIASITIRGMDLMDGTSNIKYNGTRGGVPFDRLRGVPPKMVKNVEKNRRVHPF